MPSYPTPFQSGRPPGKSVDDYTFDRARRGAFIQDILAPLRNQPAHLLPFEEVRNSLHLDCQNYLGLLDVPLDKIVGSVGRYHDFSRAFRPRRESLRQRWQRTLHLRGRLPPVDLYKVGDVYFVVDGNHRVSVARQAGALTITAHVWEYETRVPVESNDDLNDVFVRKEYLEFLRQTQLDINRPEQRIVFTVPGRYSQLGTEIARHRGWMDRQHVYTVSFEEAAVDWFDAIYLPMAEIIRERNMLGEFPGRTEADLVAYILRYRDELHREWIDSPPTPEPDLMDVTHPDKRRETEQPHQLSEHAAKEFVAKAHQDWWGRFIAWVKRRILRWEILDGSSRR
jgi:hypothetical protein